MRILFLIISLFLSFVPVIGQIGIVKGFISGGSKPLPYSTVYLKGTSFGASANEKGEFEIKDIPAGEYTIAASYVSYSTQEKKITVNAGSTTSVEFKLESDANQVDEVVITGTLKPVSKTESPVPVEVYTPTFFKSNPTPSLYEAMQNVNGVRPQVNCAVCNTGDIHINGLEGAYSMVMIDGMPIVSGLSTVYGLSGIPQSLIERVEIVKGPASTLYGSEAVGGLINVITKKPSNAPIFSGDVFGSTWGEVNADLAGKFKIGKKAESLLGVNYFNFNQKIDNNNDNFTDLTLQDRISIFNKWNFKRKNNRVFSLAGRYVYEDRFGGDLDWTTKFRGGDSIYGESIYTSRWEVFGAYQLPIKEKVMFTFSANSHDQNSVYGDSWYIANQKIGFSQLTWDKSIGSNQSLLIGAAFRYTYYDDNTPATASTDTINPNNLPTHTYLPGVFIQDEIALNKFNKVLLGMRFDYNSIHGNIWTPRLNYKWTSKNKKNILRFSTGTGYRVANVFTEDHAALTGSREVVFVNNLKPETSYNGNINYVKKMLSKGSFFFGIDGTLFYTYFNNKIFADYDSDPSKIMYDNLDGYAVSNGVSVNFDLSYKNFKGLMGATLMEVYSVQDGKKERQELTEKFTATWTLTYKIPKYGLSFDYTGNIYSPMELPTQDSETFDDPRPSQSPWWSIQNLQITKTFKNNIKLYGGVKNLLDWTPWKGMSASLLGNTSDPFEKNTPPNVLIFDPAYVYGPNQGIRGFFGLSYSIDKR